MGAKVNKAAIGGFVLGAIVLLVAAVLVLGAGKLFTTEHTYITYFSGSVKGLNVGSPVTFRGVKVGAVKDISIMADPKSTESRLKIPVIFNLEPAKFKGTKSEFQRDPKSVEKAVREFGLRTQLQSQSFVTGQLTVALDFFPDQPAKFARLTDEYPEIPSVPTPIEQLQKTLSDLPFKEIVENLNTTVAGVQRLVNSIDAKKTMQTLDESMRDIQGLVRNLNARVDPLMASLSRTSGAAEATLNETKGTMVEARGQLKQLVSTMNGTLETAQATLKQSEQTLQAYSAESRLSSELNRTLRELATTSRSLRRLSDQLERNPESVVWGKRGDKGE